MELLGRINRRKIYYVQVRNNSEWKNSLPKNDWIAFTISNEEDEELIPHVVNVCLDKNILFACNAGEFGSQAEDYFLEEIGWRGVQFEEKNDTDFDFGSPMTSAHKNFGEGFWFATVVASDGDKVMDKVVCIDFTKRKVKKNLAELINKINNNDWLPNDDEIELAEYDNR